MISFWFVLWVSGNHVCFLIGFEGGLVYGLEDTGSWPHIDVETHCVTLKQLLHLPHRDAILDKKLEEDC